MQREPRSPSKTSLCSRLFGLGVLALVMFCLAGQGQAQTIHDLVAPLYQYTAQDPTKVVAPMQGPDLPDISPYTYEALLAKIPPRQAGTVKRLPLSDSLGTEKFNEAPQHPVFSERQGRSVPEAMTLLSGVVTLEDLTELIGDPDVLQREGNTYLLRLPLHIGANAALVIGSPNIHETLRLSTDRGTFIANSGRLFVINTDLLGWTEATGRPSVFVTASRFRPFLVSWNGSEMSIGKSRLAHLGYSNSKSYGLSYSTATKMTDRLPNLKRPTGWILDSLFEDMLYGFYSYEADDVVILRNSYKNNVIYGIDPHDRSRRLIIAHNEAYGTRKKHGIIISREVNDSWIFNNNSHNNHGSGFMLDRSSVNTIVAFNTAMDNGGDGLTLFESPDNLIWKNTLTGNKRSGLRVRNSWNIRAFHNMIDSNDGASIEVYAANLYEQEKTRDFKLDPFTQKADITVAGGLIGRNKSGSFKTAGVNRLVIGPIEIRDDKKLFRGDMTALSSEFSNLLLVEKKGLEITRRVKAP